MTEDKIFARVSSLGVKKLPVDAAKIGQLFAQNEDSQALQELELMLEFVIGYIRSISETRQNVLQGLLSKALSAMENKDYVRLSDLVEYGIIPLITQ